MIPSLFGRVRNAFEVSQTRAVGVASVAAEMDG